MEEYIMMTAMSALAAAFALGLAAKWGVTEWLQVHGNAIMSEMARCAFCLSWWTNVALCVAASAVTGDTLWLAVPFCGTPITRALTLQGGML